MHSLAAVVIAGFFWPPAAVRDHWAPIVLDGAFSDWPQTAVVYQSEWSGGALELGDLWLAYDRGRVFLRFDAAAEVQLDEPRNRAGADVQHLVLAIDLDGRATTGLPLADVGADLVWRFGGRSGVLDPGGAATPLGHADLGLVFAPTVGAREFEVGLSRESLRSLGRAAFGSPGWNPGLLHFRLFNDRDDDLAVDAEEVLGLESGWLDLRFGGPGADAETPIGRSAPEAIRVATFNVGADPSGVSHFRLETKREVLDRIFRAIDADVWLLQEVGFETRERDLAARFESVTGRPWEARHHHEGIAVVSRLPLLDHWPFFAEAKDPLAVLVDARPALASDLLVVANHWKCCGGHDGTRQQQADALIGAIRNVREPGGFVTLPPTPIVVAGDLNLVEWAGPLHTLLTGDVLAGADSPPDWDGTAFDLVEARHAGARLTYTWRDATEEYAPGRLDWMAFTGSLAGLVAGFVLDTATLSDATLAAHGLLRADSEEASDHLPIVADFGPPAP
jgi:endonuclease/exonuclease/phosphatase family metal-dependent hydrolase